MAGSYPDVPGPRLAYDRDGTIVVNLLTTTGLVNQVSAAGAQNLNDEDQDSVDTYGSFGNIGGVQYGFGFVFPELRDIVGYYASVGHSGGSFSAGQWSATTTNGIDGSWTNFQNPYTNSGFSKELMRTAITSLSLTGVRGMRFLYNMGTGGSRGYFPWAVHLFGTIAAGQNPDRLRVWHPTLDSEVGGAYFDWGNVPRNTLLTREFRIKNNSATMQANTVTLTREALTDTSPTNVSQHQFSLDGVNYFTSLDIGNLAPGAISPVITLRRDTPGAAVLGLWDLRLVASAASWS